MSNKKSVIEGQIQYLSVSAITKFDARETGGCPRKWYFRYVEGIPEPFDSSLADGSAFHKEIENYLTTGTDALSPVTRAGKHFMPAPGTVDVEVSLATLTPRLTLAGFSMEGYIDCVNNSGEFIDSEGERSPMPDNTIEVIDWKSTSNLSYARHGEALKTVQMVGYAEAMRLAKGVDRVVLSQVFFQKKGKRVAIKNSVHLNVEEVADRWQGYTQIAQTMSDVAKAQSAADVEPNYQACTAFKGCPYQSICPRSQTAILQQAFGGRDMSNRLLGLINGTKTEAPKPESVAPPSISQEVVKLEQEENAIKAFAPRVLGNCPKCSAEVTDESGSRTPSGRIVHTVGCSAANPILPPDAPERSPELAAKPLPESAPVVTEAPKSEPAEAPKKTRAKKSETTKSEPSDAPKEVWTNGIQVFVDCVIDGLTTQSLDAYIEEKHDLLRKQFQVPDVRCVPDKQSPLAFGGWKGVLAASVKIDPPKADVYHVFDVSHSEIKQVILEALKPQCALFVRGVK